MNNKEEFSTWIIKEMISELKTDCLELIKWFNEFKKERTMENLLAACEYVARTEETRAYLDKIYFNFSGGHDLIKNRLNEIDSIYRRAGGVAEEVMILSSKMNKCEV